MSVSFVSAEVTSFAKAGGAADVAAALSHALNELGVDVRVVVSRYRGVATLSEVCRLSVPVEDKEVEGAVYQGLLPESGVPVWYLNNDHYFNRSQLHGE